MVEKDPWNRLVECYDLIAEDYARQFRDELEGKPFDRKLLREFAASCPPGAPICDLGCGPGHIAAHLHARGFAACGIDFSSAMVETARKLFPEIEFRVGDMHRLDLGDASLAGIAAFYSVIHVRRERVDVVFAEVRRVLMPGGAALVAFHRGAGELDADGWFDKPAHFVCTLFEPEEIGDAMRRAGLDVERSEVRQPYEFEHPTERVYVLGRNRGPQ